MTINIEFYFDPSCPWCWLTSRWLTEVSEHRDLNITWLPFSLALKNNELSGNDSTGHLDNHVSSHRVLRVIEAIIESEDIERGELYSQFGKAYFVGGSRDYTIIADEVLKRLKLNPDYAQCADDIRYDDRLRTHINNATNIVGNDVGVPLIIFVNEKGDKQGYFGPVLQSLPDTEDSLKIWDALEVLGSSSIFLELKQSRKERPKFETTKRLFSDLD